MLRFILSLMMAAFLGSLSYANESISYTSLKFHYEIGTYNNAYEAHELDYDEHNSYYRNKPYTKTFPVLLMNSGFEIKHLTDNYSIFGGGLVNANISEGSIKHTKFVRQTQRYGINKERQTTS